MDHPVRYFAASLLVLIVMPLLWPIVIVATFRSRWFRRLVRIKYPTAWDFFFDGRKPTLVVVHMNDGALLAGLWGPASYAGTFPNDGDIYLEEVYGTEGSEIGAPLPNTRGVLLRKSEYTHVEFFDVAYEKEGQHA